MKFLAKILRWFLNGFLKIFGDIKVFRWPFFVIYDPGSYRVKGTDIREVLGLMRPGDILLRGYGHYLDGYFIPGYFSHAGLYLGQVLAEDKKFVTSEKGQKLFRSGEQIVAHAMAEGVFMEDIIDFCRCDFMVVLRFPQILSRRDGKSAGSNIEHLTEAETKIVATLSQGKSVDFAQAFRTFFELALSQVGKPYDFQFNFSNFNNLSCTEFVYYCYKSLEPYHRLGPARKRYLIFDKVVLTPDAFVDRAFELVWQSRSVDTKRLEKLKEERSRI